MSTTETTDRSWLVNPDHLPFWLRRVFNAALTIVLIWLGAQLGYWLAFGALNDGPFPGVARGAYYVMISAWSAAIAIRWGFSIYRRCVHV